MTSAPGGATLETERLTLRPFTMADLDTVAAWLADPEFTRHLGGVRDLAASRQLLESAVEHWDRHGFGALAVNDRESGELIGRSGVAYHRAWPTDAEVGWWIVQPWQGRGLATEAGAASIAWAFGALELPRVVSITTEPNVASRRVMAKLGFQLEARVPSEWGELLVHSLDAPPR